MPKKWDYCQNKHNLNMPLVEHIRNDMKSMYAKFHNCRYELILVFVSILDDGAAATELEKEASGLAVSYMETRHHARKVNTRVAVPEWVK
jgi:hypothetical protein